MQGFPEHGGQRKHRPSKKRRADDNFDRHGQNCLQRLTRDPWVFHRRSRIEFHHAGKIRDRLRTRQRQDHTDELHPNRGETLMPWLEKSRGQMRRAERDQKDHYHCRRQRQRYSETPGMFRTETID